MLDYRRVFIISQVNMLKLWIFQSYPMVSDSDLLMPRTEAPSEQVIRIDRSSEGAEKIERVDSKMSKMSWQDIPSHQIIDHSKYHIPDFCWGYHRLSSLIVVIFSVIDSHDDIGHMDLELTMMAICGESLVPSTCRLKPSFCLLHPYFLPSKSNLWINLRANMFTAEKKTVVFAALSPHVDQIQRVILEIDQFIA